MTAKKTSKPKTTTKAKAAKAPKVEPEAETASQPFWKKEIGRGRSKAKGKSTPKKKSRSLAKRLGISRASIYTKMKTYGLNVDGAPSLDDA